MIKIARLLFLGIFLASFVWFVFVMLEYRKSRKEYDYLQDIFWSSEEEPDHIGKSSPLKQNQPFFQNTDSVTAAMKQINHDFTAWLYIPGTNINYPVVAADNTDFYLNHSFDGSESIGGSLFMESQNQMTEDDNVVIYGHNMKDGSMFSNLKSYADRDYWMQHPVIWLFMEGIWYEADVFSCQIKDAGEVQVYDCRFSTDVEKQGYYDSMVADSLYPTGIKPGPGHKVVTLSTCFGRSKRMIVQAVVLCYTE